MWQRANARTSRDAVTPKSLSLRPLGPLVCTAPWRVGFEQRLRYHFPILGVVLPALSPISLPKPPPGGTELGF